MEVVSPESVGLSSARLERLNKVMQQYIDRGSFAGIVTLIARKGQVAHLQTFGWQELETKRPMPRRYHLPDLLDDQTDHQRGRDDTVRRGQAAAGGPGLALHSGVQGGPSDGGRADGGYDLVPARREMTIHDLFTHSGGLSYGDDQQSALDELYRTALQDHG